MEAAYETAIQPQGEQAGRTVRGLAPADILKTGQKRRADYIAVPQDRRPWRRYGRDPAQLQTVQHLPMRQMYIGNAIIVEIQKLADAPNNQTTLQGKTLRRPLKRMWTPRGKPMGPSRQDAARIVSAEPLGHTIDLCRHLLHEKQVGAMLAHQILNVDDLRAPRMPQIPADDFHLLIDLVIRAPEPPRFHEQTDA
jgi:hypothetical protein